MLVDVVAAMLQPTRVPTRPDLEHLELTQDSASEGEPVEEEEGELEEEDAKPVKIPVTVALSVRSSRPLPS